MNWNLLKSAWVHDFVVKAVSQKMDVLKISTVLNKQGFNNDERSAIMDFIALVPKFREKFGVDFLLCDKLALEQSTAKDLGKFKATLWPSLGSVHDLCCGMGGDSFFLPKDLKITGVDLDKNRLEMFGFNLGAFNKCPLLIEGDVRNILEDADYFTIDPARRALDGENQRDLKNLTPTFLEVLEISKKYKGGMAKLPPGYPAKEFPDGVEIIYLGGKNDCRECLVLFGELAKNKDKVRAIMVDKNGEKVGEWIRPRDKSLEILDEDLQQKLDLNDTLEGVNRTYRTATSKCDLPLGNVDEFLSEPAPILIRSHLFKEAALSVDKEAHLISEGIAYVSTKVPLNVSGFSCFKILDQTELATSAVKSMLKKFDIGDVTLKLRGVKLDPVAEIKRLKPKGKKSAVLFYTRVQGEKRALLAERV